MFFNKSKAEKVGELTQEEKAEWEVISKQINGTNIALKQLTAILGESYDKLDVWWKEIAEAHGITYNSDVEKLSLDECGNVNKTAI